MTMISRSDSFVSFGPDEAKKALDQAISEVAENISDYVVQPGKDMTRSRKLPPEKIINLLLRFEAKTLRSELDDLLDQGDEVTASAFCMQRYKMKPEALKAVFEQFNASLPYENVFNGFHILACDGSDVNIWHDPSDPDTFVKRKGKNCSQVHLNALYDCLQDIYWDAEVTTAKKKEECNALIRMAERKAFPENTIITADKGYASYKVLAVLDRNNIKYLIRVKEPDKEKSIISRFDFPLTEFDKEVSVRLTRKNGIYNSDRKEYAFLEASNDFPYLEPQADGYYEMHYRVVGIGLGGGKFETLVTNLTAEEMPLSSMKELYHMRWNEETSFRTLKHVVGLVFFHSKKREGILQEIYARLILFNLIGAVVSAASPDIEKKENAKYDVKANVAVAVTNVRKYLAGELDGPGLLYRVKKNLTPIKPGRSFERRVKPQSFRHFTLRIS